MTEFTLLTKVLGIGFLLFVVYKTEVYKVIIVKVSSFISFIFGFGNKSLREVKSDKARKKAINKMISRSKFKGEL